MERTREELDIIARRLNERFPKLHFEVDNSASHGPRIQFEYQQSFIINPVRDILGQARVAPLYYGLDNDTARLILDANGIDETGFNTEE